MTNAFNRTRLIESCKPNFVSGQSSTCSLKGSRVGPHSWHYVAHGNTLVTAGLPCGPDSDSALRELQEWSHKHNLRPILFGCEEPDREMLAAWSLTEIGYQPLFWGREEFAPELSGPNQPESHRELRRQARRALAKQVDIRELSVAELWQLSGRDVFRKMFLHQWNKRGLADFSFLVECNLERGAEQRRVFLAEGSDGQILGLVLMVPCDRGWLLEHQLLSPEAPNGTGELFLCRLLSKFLEPKTCVSLGITPLYRELGGETRASEGESSLLSHLPSRLSEKLLRLWEPLYGFKSLYLYRKKLEPDIWEPVYWASPDHRPYRDTLSVLRAFAGGSFVHYGFQAIEKSLMKWSLKLKPGLFQLINRFYVLTLLLWIPILWNLDGTPLFGHPEACKVWAIYDIFLLFFFLLHQKAVQRLRSGFVTDLLLGLVSADTVLAWIQTALYHGGVPSSQPLGSFIFVINTAPLSALFFLLLFKLRCRALTRS